MNNLKVRVYTEQQAKGVIELAEKLGYKEKYPKSFKLADGYVCLDGDKSILKVCISQAGSELNEFKEISVADLSFMTIYAAQHKEYLDPHNNHDLIEWDSGKMNNYKIKVNNEAESKEVQELFFELGYWWASSGKTVSNTEFKLIHAWGDGQLTFCDNDFDDSSDFKEITLPQLHALVLEQQMASHNIEQQELKANPKLFLDPAQGYAEIEWDGSFIKQDHWVEVPSTANYLYKDNEHGNVVFTALEMGYRDSSIVWQRATQPEELPFIDSEDVVKVTIDELKETLNARQSSYGDFVHVANTTGKLFAEIKNGRNAHMLPYAHEEALHMICSKIARIVNGDCNHKDSWHDIAGYARLIEESL